MFIFFWELNIPTSVKNIEKRAFGNCFGFSGELVIPDSVVSVGEEAFYQCPFSSLKLSNNLTTISKGTFYYCDSLKGEVVLPDSVTTINDNAFKMCWFLTKFTFSASVTTIGNQVLNSCQRLTEIVVLSTTPPTLGTAVFDGTNDCPIYVPAGSVEVYKNATNWSAYASRIQAIV